MTVTGSGKPPKPKTPGRKWTQHKNHQATDWEPDWQPQSRNELHAAAIVEQVIAGTLTPAQAAAAYRRATAP